MADIIGTGIAFPLRVDRARRPRARLAATTTWRRRSRIILGTAPGERPMRPEFGCGIHDHVFDVIDALDARAGSSTRSASRSTAGSRGSTSSTSTSTSTASDDGRAADRHHLPAARRRTTCATSCIPFYLIPAEEREHDAMPADRRSTTGASRISSTRPALRIAQLCPEWTEHNVSDPGITLIELFAWMTEMLDLPAQPRAGQAARGAARAARHPARRRRSPRRPSCASGSRAPAAEPVEIPAGETEVGTVRTANEESIVFQTSEDFTIPPLAARAPTSSSASGAVKDVGVAGGVGAPEGRRPAAVRHAAEGRRRALPRLRRVARAPARAGRRRLLAGARRRRRSRGSAAALGGLDRRTRPSWAEASVLSDLTGGFNYGCGAIELQLPPRQRRSRDRRPARATGCAAAWTPHAHRRVGRRVHAPARDLRDRRRRRSARIPRRTPRTAGRRDARRRATARPASASSCATRPCSSPRRRAPRGARARRRRLGALGAARVVRRERARGPPLRARRGRRRDRARPGRPRARRQLAAVRGVPPKGAAAALERATATAAAAHGNVAAGTLTCSRRRSRASPRSRTRAGAIGGVDRETLESARARAADGAAHALPRGHRASDFEFLCGEASPRVARAICLPPARRGRCACSILPGVAPADRQLAVHELIAGRRAPERGRRVPGRAPADRHDASSSLPGPRSAA